MLQVEEISSQERFKSLKHEWMDLLNQSVSNTVFLNFQWLYTWWNIFKENKELKILLVRDGNNLVGIAPFFVHKTKYAKVLPVKEVKMLGGEEVGSDYLDFIIRQGREEEVLDTIFHYLKENKKDWDCIRLDSISAESKNINMLRERIQKNKYYFNIRNCSVCPYIDLPKSWRDYISSLSNNMRYNIRRKTKKLEQENDIEFKLISEKEQLNKAIDDFINLNQMRLKSKKIVGAFRVANFMQFHKHIIPQLHEQGIVKLFFLLVNKSPIGSLYIFQYNNKYLYYQSGFDSQWAKFSPGTVMFSYCIKHAIEQGIEEFDFLQGEENYKNHWAKANKTTLEITIFKNSLKNKMIHLIEKQRPKIGRIRNRISNKC